MTSADYSYDPLIRWVVKYSPVSKYNMSLSGLPEVKFSDFGIDTSYRPDLGDRKGMEKVFRDELCKLYGFPEKKGYGFRPSKVWRRCSLDICR